jgi:hypothetical protein
MQRVRMTKGREADPEYVAIFRFFMKNVRVLRRRFLCVSRIGPMPLQPRLEVSNRV